jgi:adenylate cyclase
VIALLNDYADAVISAVQEQGGDVLKLIGDAVLAIFKAEDPEVACHRALAAEADLRRRLVELNTKRAGQEKSVTTVYLGLHIGQVSYGNVGSNDRLDFTVVGPAVNEVNRIASMCRSAERNVLLSADFVNAASGPDRERCVSVGRFAFRGVQRPRELFTLDDAGPGD